MLGERQAVSIQQILIFRKQNQLLLQLKYPPMSKKPVVPPKNNKPVAAPAKKVWQLEDYVTATVSAEEVKEVKIAFDIFDADGSGFVDAQELKHAFVQLGFGTTNKFAYSILHDLDTEESKGISFEQFLKLATSKLSDKHSRAEIEKVFKHFDTHKLGKITTEELKQVAHELGDNLTNEQIEKIFVKADQDEDGYVTVDDFYAIITNNGYWE